jgi:succinyl-CoA synthetase beta subunit
MRLLEFEAKEIFKEYGVTLPAGQLVSSEEEFNLTAPTVLKAQIPIGGRG